MAHKKVNPTKQSKEFTEAHRLVDMAKRLSNDGTTKKHAEAKIGFKTKSDAYLKYILNIKRSKFRFPNIELIKIFKYSLDFYSNYYF